MASAHASCNMLFEELAEEDPARKPASPCPYCNAALAFHRRRQRGVISYYFKFSVMPKMTFQ